MLQRESRLEYDLLLHTRVSRQLNGDGITRANGVNFVASRFVSNNCLVGKHFDNVDMAGNHHFDHNILCNLLARVFDPEVVTIGSRRPCFGWMNQDRRLCFCRRHQR